MKAIHDLDVRPRVIEAHEMRHVQVPLLAVCVQLVRLHWNTPGAVGLDANPRRNRPLEGNLPFS